jgi:two-component system chemotaxis response regulator CheB
MIRVLVVDDSVFMRTIVSDMLKKDPAIDVVGTASDGIEALKKCAELSPDVITLDIEMPRMDGIEVLRRLMPTKHAPKVLMLSSLTSKDAEMTREALRLGAGDFMLKPRDIATVRGIEQELTIKIKHLIRFPMIARHVTSTKGIADRIVVIGSSAGGPQQLDVLLSSLDPDLPAAVVVTQHMPVGFTAALAERLNRISLLPVKESQNGDLLERGQVIVSKAGFHTVVSSMVTADGIRGGRIVHSTAPPIHAVRPAVDATFTTAAKTFAPRIVSVLLSGMGSDGGEGMFAVKEAGGTTICCDQDDCLVYGMARSALERNCVDHVVPLKKIAGEIGGSLAELGDA